MYIMYIYIYIYLYIYSYIYINVNKLCMSFTNIKICISRTREVVEHIYHIKDISNNLTILDEVRSVSYSILDKNSHR